MLNFNYKDGNIIVNEISPENYSVTYKNVTATYMFLSQEDALQLFIEALKDKSSVIYRLLKGGDSK
jgi:hypothetical protein